MSRMLPPVLTVIFAMIAFGAGPALAQQNVDQTWCRAGTLSTLAKDEKLIVWSLDHHGVSRARDPKDPLDAATQRCIGVLAVIDGKTVGNGWCKVMDSQSGDWWLVDWATADKPGHGTWSYRHGSGKYKGVTGGGTYQSLGQTRPIEAGTYQNCVRVTGTMKLPG